MSNINKQALREMAERAASDSWGYDRDEFNDAITPEVVLALLDELEAKDKRITELEAKLETADKLQGSSFRHGLQHGFSLGQTDNQAGFEQAIHAYGQQWKGE
ncbi:ead/Ea22-like family protein [Enterobacter hormaechei subsp. steigerwaltii]|nr:ead/Ea22-like family protein [Enterobacter hormaechei subsp. steigerwaltii]MCU3321895.1 ead/Ea22-like family protein [Enterobacter hormaechei subsp. steigerwaltii]